MACANKKCNSVQTGFLKAAIAHYEAQRDESIAVLDVYFNKPVAIADHSNFLDEIKKWTSKLAEAEDCLNTLERHWS